MQAGVLSDIESEFAGMAAQLAESDTQAVAREAAVRVSKEQWIRLNADFDNFRKRTVRAAVLEWQMPVKVPAWVSMRPAVCVFEPMRPVWCMLGVSAVAGMPAIMQSLSGSCVLPW